MDLKHGLHTRLISHGSHGNTIDADSARLSACRLSLADTISTLAMLAHGATAFC